MVQPAPDPEAVARARLGSSTERVAMLQESLRRELVIRDQAVDVLRAAGWSWEQIAALAGVSRQALTKRSGAPSRAHP